MNEHLKVESEVRHEALAWNKCTKKLEFELAAATDTGDEAHDQIDKRNDQLAEKNPVCFR